MEQVRQNNYVKNDASRIVNLGIGKLPPQALDIEEAILGGALIDQSGLDGLFEVITNPDVFYKDAHKHIFKAVKSLYDRGVPVDLLTVSAELKATACLSIAGGDYYLIQLTQKISSSAHIEYHSRIVLQKYIARQVIKIANASIEQAYDETTDVFALMDFVDTQFTAIGETISHGKRLLSWSEMLDQVLQNVEMLTNAGDKILGIETGFKKLNKHFGGWRPTDLIIIAGRPGSGKTAFTIRTVVSAAKAGEPVGYFSLEMSGVQLTTRGVANDSNFHLNQLTRTGFEKPEYFKTLMEQLQQMRSLPIYIDDDGGLTISEFKRRARRMKRKHGIKIIIFDYVQLAAGDAFDVRKEVNAWVYALKAIAKELNVPVIALSQLSREVEKRNPQRGRMSDLKESSAIEDAADVIAFLYRPGYYGNEIDSAKLDEDENTEFIIEKNRHGGVGTVGLWFDGNKTKFTDSHIHYNNDGEVIEANEVLGEWKDKPLPTPTPAQAFSIEDVSTMSAAADDDTPF